LSDSEYRPLLRMGDSLLIRETDRHSRRTE
jgi:ribosomal protein S28E/S33